MSSLGLNAPNGVTAPLSAMDALPALLASPPLPPPRATRAYVAMTHLAALLHHPHPLRPLPR